MTDIQRSGVTKDLMVLVLLVPLMLFTLKTPVSLADDNGVLTVDAMIDMNGSPVGTQTTPTIMKTGTRGFAGVNWEVNDSVAALKVGPQRFNLPAPIKIDGVVYPVDYPHQSLAYDTSYSFNDFRAFLPDNNYNAVTTSGFITLGIPNQGSSGSLSDLVRIDLTSGAFAVMQLYNGNGPGYVLNIESDGNGTIHSSKITVTPGETYWYSFKADYGVGRAYLNVYDLPNFNLIGSVTLNTRKGSGIEYIQYGNGEEAESSGRGINFNYFENSIIDYSNAVFPLGPFANIPTGPDSEAPSAPTNLITTDVLSSSVSLSWTASTDNIGVAGYKIFRNGTQIAVSSSPSYTDNGLSVLTTYTYTISAYDYAGNNSPESSPQLDVTTTMDNAPTVSISSPTNNTTLGTGNKTITAVASDDIKVLGVQFLLDGVNLGSEDTTSPYSKVWDTSLTTNGAHVLSAIARDGAGNTTRAVDVNIIFDNQSPSGSISINGGAIGTNLRNVVLTLSAIDTIGPITQMRFSNTNTSSSFSTPENYNGTKSWTLSSGSGNKTVYVKFKDIAGNWSSAFSDNIILDTIAPTISNVTVSNRTIDSALITWITNEPATSQIQYGPTSSYGQLTTFDSNLNTVHSMTIVGLNPNTKYYYQVISKDSMDNQKLGPKNNLTTLP